MSGGGIQNIGTAEAARCPSSSSSSSTGEQYLSQMRWNCSLIKYNSFLNPWLKKSPPPQFPLCAPCFQNTDICVAGKAALSILISLSHWWKGQNYRLRNSKIEDVRLVINPDMCWRGTKKKRERDEDEKSLWRMWRGGEGDKTAALITWHGGILRHNNTRH